MDNAKKTKLLTLLIIIMVIAIGFVAFKLVTLNQNYTELEQQMSQTVTAKDLLEEDLKELYTEYDSIQTDNDTLNAKLLVEQEKVGLLLEQIKTKDIRHYSEVTQYQNEIESYRKMMKNYIFQIDSLNQLNNQLQEENNEVRKNNLRLKSEIDEVVEKNDELTQTVEQASIIKATNIKAGGYKSRGRETNRARRVSQIRTNFTLIENSIAEPGERTIYVRIIRPDEYLLSKNSENVFAFQEQSIPYSESRKVQYEGNFLDVVIYYDVEQDLLKGTYKVELYMDGNIIGTSDFLLK